MFLKIDGTLVVQIVNFVLFIVVLNAVFLKPVGAAIARRRAVIDGVSRDIESAERELRGLHSTADDHRSQARREADAAMATARATAQEQAATVLADYQTKAAAISEAAHAQIATEIAGARESESDVVESLAQTMVATAMASGAR